MLSFSKARRIAETWVSVVTDGRAVIAREAVEAKPYGWVFYYQSQEAIDDPNNISAKLAGNAPFIVDRINCEVRVLGTAHYEQKLAEYEKALPPAVLLCRPELPHW